MEFRPRLRTERRKISVELEKYARAPWLEAAALPPNLDNDKPSRGALELLFFRPAPVWEKVKVPVFLVWGDKDTVVPVAEGRKIIEDSLAKAGNKNVTVKIFPNVDHAITLVNAKKGADFPRAALDYLDAAELHEHASFAAFDDFRRAHGRRLVLLTTKASLSAYAARFDADDILMVGRESAGVPEAVAMTADLRIRIPMRPGLRSLNVAVAAALVVGEAKRQTDAFEALQ